VHARPSFHLHWGEELCGSSKEDSSTEWEEGEETGRSLIATGKNELLTNSEKEGGVNPSSL